jgi:4-coumarate--CoA ligase
MVVVKDVTSEYVKGNCGHIAPNCEIKIIDTETGKNLAANHSGEICVRSPSVFSGYYRNPKATTDTIDNDGFVHTGDIGYYDEYGRLFIVDRIKEMIKLGLSSVAPAEIEQGLLSHNSVKEVVVVGVPQSIGVQWPRAYVVVKHDSIVTEEELQDFIKG